MSRAQRRHRHDARLVDAAPDDHVDLDRREAGLDGGGDPVEDPLHREVDPVHRPEDRVVERVEADRHPLQPGVGQRTRERAQGRAVRRQGQVHLAAVGPADRRQQGDEVGQVAPDERLATGDAQLLDAQPDEDARQAFDLLERQDLVLGQERVVLAEDLLGHAVGAAEVAAVGDRDAQVAQGPAQRIGQAGSSIERHGKVHVRTVPGCRQKLARRLDRPDRPGAPRNRPAGVPVAPRNEPGHGWSAGTTGANRWYL